MKGSLKLPDLHILVKQEKFITSQNFGSWDFWQIVSVLNKGNSAMLPLFNSLEVLSSGPEKTKVFAKNRSKKSNLDDSDVSLPVFLLSRTILKPHSVSVILKMVKRPQTFIHQRHLILIVFNWWF